MSAPPDPGVKPVIPIASATGLGDRLRYVLGTVFMRAFGWRVEGEVGNQRRFVLIAAPHTSGWDLPFMLATTYVLGVKLSWLGKHTLFTWWGGWIMRWLGGIPVDRRAPQQLVARVARAITDAPHGLVVAIPPQGTRSKVEYWKSGFYRIALAASVPIGCGFLDYSRKVSGIGPFIVLTGDVKADMEQVRRFYAPIVGKYPALQTEPKLKEELGEDQS